MRPMTPLAVENGVGKLAANLAPNRQPGKESVAHSHPPFMPPFGRKAGRGHLFRKRLASVELENQVKIEARTRTTARPRIDFSDTL